MYRIIARYCAVEIYPREGTEAPLDIREHELHNVEIYPREGTETERKTFLESKKKLKSIPVRGRKLIKSAHSPRNLC